MIIYSIVITINNGTINARKLENATKENMKYTKEMIIVQKMKLFVDFPFVWSPFARKEKNKQTTE